MSESRFDITHLLVIYPESSPPAWLASLKQDWPNLTPVKWSGNHDAGSTLEQVKQFYGKTRFLGERIASVKSAIAWLFCWITKKPPSPKLGDCGSVVVVDRRVLPNAGHERFGLLQAIRDELYEYYLLIVLSTDTVVEDRREANLAGAYVVLDTNHTEPATLREEVFAFRAAEATYLESDARSRRIQIRLWLLTLVASAVLSWLPAAGRWVWRTCAEDHTDRISCEVFLGRCENIHSDAIVEPIWQECCLRISNENGSPKSHFAIRHDLAGLPIRNLPKVLTERIEVGHSAEIRFQIGLPKRLSDDFPLHHTKMVIQPRGMPPLVCPLESLLLEWSKQRPHGAVPCPPQSASAQ